MNHDRLVEVLNSSNLEETIKGLSYEEKVAILANNSFVKDCIVTKLINSNIKMFNEEESLRLYQEHHDLVVYKLGRIHRRIDDIFFAGYKCIAPLLELPDEIIIKEYAKTGYYEYTNLIKDPHNLLAAFDSFNYDQRSIALRGLPDELLAELIVKRKYKEHINQILYLFKSDEYKMLFLHKKDPKSRSATIAKLSQDNIKKYITPLAYDKGLLIAQLESDQEKENYLESYEFALSSEDKANILASFKDENYIIRNSKYLKTDEEKYLFIIKYSYTRDINGDFFRNMIFSITNEKYLRELIMLNENHTYFDNNFMISLLDRIHNSKELYELYCNIERNDYLSGYILTKLSQRDIRKYVNNNMEYLGDYHILLYLNDQDLLFEALNHYDFVEEYKDDMLPLFKVICRKYNLNIEHLIALTRITGCGIIQQITNDNIRNAINLDEENFKKYLLLLEKDKPTMSRNAIDSILNSLLNKKFSIEFPDKIEIFINTLHAIKDGDLELAANLISEVLARINLDHFNIQPLDLIRGVLTGDKDIIKLYNKMTYEYLTNMRNQYVNENIDDEMKKIMSWSYEKNSLIKYMIKVLPEDMLFEIIYNYYDRRGRAYYNLSDEEKQLIDNKDLLMQLIAFKKNPKKGIINDNKKHLRTFNTILKTIFSYCNSFNIDGLPTVYDTIQFDNHKAKLIEIISNIDVSKLKDLVFNNPEMFDELLKYLDRYDVLTWDGRFDRVARDSDIEISYSTIASLISNFYFIIKKKREKESRGERFTFTSELAEAECLDSDASIYSYLFGLENYRLLSSNPGPNSSPKSREYRLNKALELLHVMHNRKYITVPPVDKDFKLNSGKTININIGNTNNPINLTYGERTGACMRIGGAGSTLFDFCLKSENGFHISFNHPVTGELISRVSCFRNGNTVFFNQVRNSLSGEYSNNDIREACTLIGKEIIELTKNSKYPIKNVVTTNYYAYSGSVCIDSNCKSPTRGFIPPFYTDIGREIVVVATATGKLSPIELGPSKAERYKVGRTHIRKFDINKAKNKVMYIEALDAFFSHIPIDKIEIKEKDVISAYVGEDWYVAITSDGKIINYVSKTSRDIQKANEEMYKYLKIVQDTLDNILLETGIKGQVR